MTSVDPSSRGYFRGLNYTLGDEDSTVELNIAPDRAGHIVSIAGSGGRVIPLLAKSPGRLTCIDITPVQLQLTELRIESLRQLSYEDFLGFWGYPPFAYDLNRSRKVLEDLQLSTSARNIATHLLDQVPWQALIYRGRFEKTLITLSKINRVLIRARGRGIFDCESLDEQLTYFRESFPQRSWRLVLMLLANSAVLNRLLYKGEFPKKNIPGSTYGHYKRIFESLFTSIRARESFFLQMVFLGKIAFPEGNPVECRRDVFEAAKNALGDTEVRYYIGDFVDALKSDSKPVNFLSLSDVPSFLPDSRAVRCLTDVRPHMQEKALIVCRGHLRVVVPDIDGYDDVTDRYAAVIADEKTQLWTIHVYRACG